MPFDPGRSAGCLSHRLKADGAFAPYERFRLGRKPRRRADSLRPSSEISGGWGRSWTAGTQKRGTRRSRVPLFWSRVRESNPPPRLGKPMYYRCTNPANESYYNCPLYTTDAADEGLGVDTGGRGTLKEKNGDSSEEQRILHTITTMTLE